MHHATLQLAVKQCRCGGTVHGACRQFFEAGAACVEHVEGGDSSELSPGELPVGWRKAVNRAGVVNASYLRSADIGTVAL